MNSIANHFQRCFEITVRRFECVGVNGERGTQDNERCTELRTLNGLLKRQATDRLHRDHEDEVFVLTRETDPGRPEYNVRTDDRDGLGA